MRRAICEMVRTGTPDDLRMALLDQLAHTIDEAQAVRPLISKMPDAALTLRPAEEGYSVKELYGSIAAWDMEVFTPVCRGIATETEYDVKAPDLASWHDLPITDILDHLVGARTELVSVLRDATIERWAQQGELWGESYDLYGLARKATLHTASAQQRAARQLNPSL